MDRRYSPELRLVARPAGVEEPVREHGGEGAVAGGQLGPGAQVGAGLHVVLQAGQGSAQIAT